MAGQHITDSLLAGFLLLVVVGCAGVSAVVDYAVALI
jgi:hypothetical protein